MKRFTMNHATLGLALVILIFVVSFAPSGEPVIAVSRNTQDPTTCQNAVQGKIAWNYEGNKNWAAENLARLCRGSSSDQPAQCFDRAMHGGINWGGGTRWQWANAIDLCEQSHDANATISCFQRKTAEGISWSRAISSCDERAAPDPGPPTAVPTTGAPIQASNGQYIACPVVEVQTQVTTKLPAPWWNTPQAGRLEKTSVMDVAGKQTLVCEYLANRQTSSMLMREAPANANCKATTGGFRCY